MWSTWSKLCALQDGEAQDKVHAHVRIQFNTMPTYDARVSFPKAAFIKELSFRSAKPDAAQKFVQARCSLHSLLYYSGSVPVPIAVTAGCAMW
jgi:hypothetical protein